MNKTSVLTKTGAIKNTLLGEFERIFSSKINHVHTPRQALEQWVSELRNPPAIKGRVAILAARNNTWIEWAAYCAAVVRRMGYQSTVFYTGSEVRRIYPQTKYFNFWSGVGKIPDITLIDLESLKYDRKIYNQYKERCHRDSVAALAYDLRLESADILDDPGKYGTKLEALKEITARNGARLYHHFENNKYVQFICYSGLISDTSMMLQAALDQKQEVVCVEGWAWRPGHMIFNFNAPALEYNLKGWLKSFGEWNEQKENEMKRYFNFLEGKNDNSEWLKDFQFFQKDAVKPTLPDYIDDFVKGNEKIFLLACNVIGDSALLNRETIFRSHRDFIKQTVDFFNLRTDLKLIIRVHPGETWNPQKVVIKMGEVAGELARDKKNILVIDAVEKLNTFSLIPYIHGGIVWISSVGVDMVARGVPVIAAAMPKYRGLGIVEEPETPEKYFELIERFAASDIKPAVGQVQKAKEYLYLLSKGFSLEAQGRNFRASSCLLGKMPSQKEHDRFYRIILKLEPSPDQL